MKTRFDGLDVLAMCCHLQRTLLGAKVVNIYDALDSNNNKDSYTLKLDSGNGKVFLKLQSGVQFHAVVVGNPQDDDKNNSSTTTVVENFANTAPSPFCSKLRKHLKGMRLEHICQLGQLDRVVWFKFLGSTGTCSLILELYSKGNLVLTQGPQFEIVALLRSHVYSGATTQQEKEGNETNEDSTPNENADVQVRVGKVYPVTYATTTTSATNDAKEDDPGGLLAPNLSDALQWVQEQLEAEYNTNKKPNKKKGNATGLTLKTLLLKPSSGVSHYGPALLEHVIWSCNSVAGENDADENNFTWKPHEPLAIDGKQCATPAVSEDDKETPAATTSNKVGGLTREQWQTLIHQLKTEAPAVLERLRQAAQHEMPGYLLYKLVDDDNSEKEKDTTSTKTSNALIESTLPHPNKMLLEFQPHLLRQHKPNLLQQKNVRVLETRDFGRAVADFYGQLQSQKTRQKALSQQQAAQARLRNIQLDQQQRAAALERDIYQQQQRAALVEAHAAQVDQALQILNSALQSGMDWEQLHDVIHVEQEERHNPIALLIHELKLQDDEVVLRLPTTTATIHRSEDEDDDQDNNNKDTKDDDTTPPYLDVTVRLQETAHANASRLFANYRASKEKSRKTQEASEKAMAAAQATAERQLAQAQNQLKGGGGGGGLYAPRKPAWFEKFYWMVTRDNYLVLCGKDAHQNELLVKRYLRRGDAYLHADVHGAASCVLRAKRARRNNNSKSEPLPLSEMALQEAGQFTLCHSSAWSSRMMTSAWWVESHQVSKTAPTGEYLTVGSFMVRGKKNYLPPSPLELGLGVLFKLGDAESIARHKDKDRRDFMLLHQQTEEEEEQDLGKHDAKPVAEAQPDADEGEGLKNSHVLSENNDDPAQDNGENDAQQEREDGLVESMGPALSEPHSDDDKEDGASTEPTAERNADEGEAEKLAPDKIANGQLLGNEEAVTEEVPVVAPSKKKKGLSVKDRKLIKKYGSLEEAERVLSQQQQEQQSKQNALAATSIPNRLSDTASLASSSAATNHTANTVKRGKKSKLKRQKKRYADQDDEDRELALLLLHGGGGPKTNGGNQKNKGSCSAQNKAQPKTTAEQLVGEETAAALTKNSRVVADRLPESVRVVLEKCLCDNCDRDSVPWERIDGDVVEQLVVLLPQEAQLAAVERLASLQESTQVSDHLTSSLAGILRTIRKYGYKNLGEADTKKNDKAGEHSEDNGDQNEEDEEEIDDTAELNKLTGKPVIEDVLLHAVPICAPYASLSGCSYRVKLTPGNMKRGKAGKQCLEIILQQVQQQSKLSSSSNSGTNNIHRELIKRVTDNELVQCLISDVKIAAAGSSKLIKQQKGKGKKKK